MSDRPALVRLNDRIHEGGVDHAIDKLASVLQEMLDKVDGDPCRDWGALSGAEQDYFRLCIARLLSERSCVEQILLSDASSLPPHSKLAHRDTRTI